MPRKRKTRGKVPRNKVRTVKPNGGRSASRRVRRKTRKVMLGGADGGADGSVDMASGDTHNMTPARVLPDTGRTSAVRTARAVSPMSQAEKQTHVSRLLSDLDADKTRLEEARKLD